MTKNSIRSAPCTATGPVSTPSAAIRASAVVPATTGTSRTSKTRPVARITFASGRASHHCPMIALFTVACICQVGEAGCAPGAGQPIRSHEQARPGSGIPSPSNPKLGWAPWHTGQPIAAYSRAAAPSAGGRCAAERRPFRRIIVTIRPPARTPLSVTSRHGRECQSTRQPVSGIAEMVPPPADSFRADGSDPRHVG